jgi:hypothetical protein
MAGAGHHVGQIGLVIVKQRDWLLQLSPLSVAGSSSPPPCIVVSILLCACSPDEHEGRSSRLKVHIPKLSPPACQIYDEADYKRDI